MFSEFGGESFSPSEGASSASEGLSEAAKAKFAGQAAGAAQVRAQSQKAQKRDQSVANAIIAFLTDAQRQHLATLIARIVARDCPSPFLLAILSLINAQCLEQYLAYAHEQELPDAAQTRELTLPNLPDEQVKELADWVVRVEQSLGSDPQRIIQSLLEDADNFDPTLLQLTTFVLEEFLRAHDKSADFEKLQPLAAMILQTVFSPYLTAEQQQETAQELMGNEAV